MNDINEDIKETLLSLIRRTNDDFGLTLSGNPISKEIIDQAQKVATDIHNQRMHA